MYLWLQWLVCAALLALALIIIARHFGWLGRRPSSGCAKCAATQHMIEQLKAGDQP